MLADPTYVREVDLSHFANSIADLDVHPRSSHSIRYLLIGLFISTLLHGVLFFWQGHKPELPASTQHIQLTLRYTDIAAKESIELSVTPEKPATHDVAPVLTPAAIIPDAAIGSGEVLPPAQQARIITSLSRAEMDEIYVQHKSSNAPQTSGSITDNVFHPGLRERLATEENKPDLQRVDAGPKTYSDPSGATIVDLDGGKCLRSSVVTKAGEMQNWYMAGCGGKSEAERMIEQVNERINGKLRFDE